MNIWLWKLVILGSWAFLGSCTFALILMYVILQNLLIKPLIIATCTRQYIRLFTHSKFQLTNQSNLRKLKTKIKNLNRAS